MFTTCREYGVTQIINTPTRVTQSSQTLLDHIYVNNMNNFNQRGAVSTFSTDHHLVYVISKKLKTYLPPKMITYRPYKELDPDDFNNFLTTLNTNFLGIPDVNVML